MTTSCTSRRGSSTPERTESWSFFINAASRMAATRGLGLHYGIVYTVERGIDQASGLLRASREGPRSRGPVGARRSRRLLSLRDTARAMSQESTTPDLVELVRKQLEALDRRDLDGVMNSVAEDSVLEGRVENVEGRAAIRRFLDDWFRAWEELDFELEEVSDLGGGVVFAVVIQDGRPVGGDGRVRQREGWVYLWVGGSIARLTTSEVDQARAAAERLAEQRG